MGENHRETENRSVSSADYERPQCNALYNLWKQFEDARPIDRKPRWLMKITIYLLQWRVASVQQIFSSLMTFMHQAGKFQWLLFAEGYMTEDCLH